MGSERIQPIIRPEAPEDEAAIGALTSAAFATVPYASGDEAAIIERLRSGGSLALSLVASRGGKLLGQVTLSPAIADDGAEGWFALGPLSVDPAHAGRGIGSALCRAAIAWLRERDAAGCVLLGDPAYYARFGFVTRPDLAPAGQPAENYQVLELAGKAEGGVDFDPAFAGS